MVPRILEISFICKEDAYPYNIETVKCGESVECEYFLSIETGYACSSKLSVNGNIGR